MSLLVRLAVMFGVLAVGVALRYGGVLAGRRRRALNALTFYTVLPALLFTMTYDRPLESLLSPSLVAGLVITYAAIPPLAWLLQRGTRPPATRSIAVAQSYHTNYGYIGLPVVAATLGAAAAGQASVVLGIGTLLQVPLTIVILITVNEVGGSVARELRRLVTNPVLISLTAGLTIAGAGLTVPDVVVWPLDRLATLSLPLALLLVGSAVDPTSFGATDSLPALGTTVATKVVLMPTIAFAAFTAVGASPLARSAGVVMLGAPTAVSTVVYATELGGDDEFASATIFATTLAFVGTLGLLVGVVF